MAINKNKTSRKKLPAILLEYPVNVYTLRESDYLYEALIDYYRFYTLGGISILSLLRQSGLSMERFQEVMLQYPTLIKELEQQMKKPCRESSIFDRDKTIELLLSNSSLILTMLQSGEELYSIFNRLNCIPSTKAWEKFRRTMRKEGVDFKELGKYSNLDISDIHDVGDSLLLKSYA